MEVNQTIKDYMAALGKKSAAKLTPEQRSERARNAGRNKGKHAKNTTKLDVQPQITIGNT